MPQPVLDVVELALGLVEDARLLNLAGNKVILIKKINDISGDFESSTLPYVGAYKIFREALISEEKEASFISLFSLDKH